MLLSQQINRVNLYFTIVAVVSAFVVAGVIAQVSSSIAAGLIIGAILAIAGIAHYEVLIHAMIVLLPLQSSVPYGLKTLGSFNAFNALAAVIFAVWVVNAILQRERLLNWSGMNFVLALFVLISVAALFRSVDFGGSRFMDEQINPFKRWITPMLLFFPVANGRFSRPALKRMIITVLITLAVVTLWTLKDLYNLGWDEISEENRIGGPFGFGAENDLAAFFVYYPVLALAIGLFEKRLHYRVVLFGLFMTSMLPLLLSFSRGAYLGIAAALLFLGLTRFRWLLLVIVVAGVSYKSWTPTTVQQRVRSTEVVSNELVGGRVPSPNDPERNLEPSAALRMRIWRGAWSIIETHPFTGIGFGVFPYAIPSYANMEPNMDAHNEYLLIASEMGVGGLAAFLLVLLVPFFSMWRVYRTSGDRLIRGWMLGLMGSVCGMIMVNIFGSRFGREELVGLYWILIGLTYAYIYLRRNRIERLKEWRTLKDFTPAAEISPSTVVAPASGS
jgi:O-antigen ligase